MLANLNEETINKLYRRVDNILANLAFNDWHNTNYLSNGKKKYKKNHPYSLSDETEEAREILHLIHNDMSKEDEETIKSFILKYRLLKPEYLETRP